MIQPQPDPFPLPWQQGEHVAVVGDTGTGKTFLLSRLIPLRKYVVVFRTKPDDIKFPGFRTVRRAEAMDDWRSEHILLQPKYENQGKEGAAMLNKVWEHGGWTVVIDELWYAERLGLRPHLERLLTQGRSKKITVVVGMQRPVWVSRFALSQCTHLFSFRTEGRDGKVLAEAFTRKIIPYIDDESPTVIRGHDFAYFNRARRVITTGNARRISRVISGSAAT